MAAGWVRRAAWAAWFLIAVLGGFGTLEYWNMGEGGVTLSQFVAEMNEAWPVVGPILGMIFGGLIVHFFWPWRHPRLK